MICTGTAYILFHLVWTAIVYFQSVSRFSHGTHPHDKYIVMHLCCTSCCIMLLFILVYAQHIPKQWSALAVHMLKQCGNNCVVRGKVLSEQIRNSSCQAKSTPFTKVVQEVESHRLPSHLLFCQVVLSLIMLEMSFLNEKIAVENDLYLPFTSTLSDAFS